MSLPERDYYDAWVHLVDYPEYLFAYHYRDENGQRRYEVLYSRYRRHKEQRLIAGFPTVGQSRVVDECVSLTSLAPWIAQELIEYYTRRLPEWQAALERRMRRRFPLLFVAQ